MVSRCFRSLTFFPFLHHLPFLHRRGIPISFPQHPGQIRRGGERGIHPPGLRFPAEARNTPDHHPGHREGHRKEEVQDEHPTHRSEDLLKGLVKHPGQKPCLKGDWKERQKESQPDPSIKDHSRQEQMARVGAGGRHPSHHQGEQASPESEKPPQIPGGQRSQRVPHCPHPVG